jgi:hypothetical protein
MIPERMKMRRWRKSHMKMKALLQAVRMLQKKLPRKERSQM